MQVGSVVFFLVSCFAVGNSFLWSYPQNRWVTLWRKKGYLAVRAGLSCRVTVEADPTLFAGLTAGQQAGSRLILESPDRFVGIQGYAGVGKTTQFKAVLAAINTLPDAQRPEVIGLAPTHRAVGEMASVGVKAQTIASFLMDSERRTQSGETLDFSRTLFLVDESSMIGNRDMSDTLSRIAAAGGRAVMSGDEKQLLSVENGAPFSLMQQRSALDVAIMKDIVRQSPELRPAVEAIIERQIAPALNVIESVTPGQVPREVGVIPPKSSVEEHQQTPKDKAEKGDLVIDAIVRDYTGRIDTARAQTLIVTQTNDDKRAVNQGIHDTLKELGKLGEATVSIAVFDREKTHVDALKSVSGMAKFNGGTVLINKEYYTLTVGKEGKQQGVVTLIDTEGQPRLLSAFESSVRDVAIFKSREIELSVGDKVSFSQNDKERDRDANTRWTVSAIADNQDITLTHNGKSRVINPSTDPADRHLDYAYAGTAHKAQGASEQFVIVLAGVTATRKYLASHSDAYVALSRMKSHVQVYTDNLIKWSEAVGRAGSRKTAHDVLHASDDRQADTGNRLWEQARPLADNGLGRALLRDSGLSEQGEARFISGSKKYPSPHVAWPAYDANGRQSGVWLDEVRLNDDGYLQGLAGKGRLLGSESSSFVVLQQSQNGETQLAKEVDNTSEVKPTAITGDMHSINKANFAILHWFGLRFEPHFTDLNKQLKELYCTRELSAYKKCLIQPVGQINQDLIIREKNNFDRIVATLGLKEMTQGTLMRKLCTYTTANPTRQAIFEYDRLVRSIYTLKYLRDPQLERNIRRSQNRIESYHQLRAAVSKVGGKKELSGKNDLETEISNQCGRLICNAIVYYNSAILSRLLERLEAEGNAKGIEVLTRISPVAWQHILLNGHYTFHSSNEIMDLNALVAGLKLG